MSSFKLGVDWFLSIVNFGSDEGVNKIQFWRANCQQNYWWILVTAMESLSTTRAKIRQPVEDCWTSRPCKFTSWSSLKGEITHFRCFSLCRYTHLSIGQGCHLCFIFKSTWNDPSRISTCFQRYNRPIKRLQHWGTADRRFPQRRSIRWETRQYRKCWRSPQSRGIPGRERQPGQCRLHVKVFCRCAEDEADIEREQPWSHDDFREICDGWVICFVGEEREKLEDAYDWQLTNIVRKSLGGLNLSIVDPSLSRLVSRLPLGNGKIFMPCWPWTSMV